MYTPNNTYYDTYIKPQARAFSWKGTIKTTTNTTYNYTSKHIRQNSGVLTRAISSSTDIEIGSTYASEYKVDIFYNAAGITATAEKLIGGTITLEFKPDGTNTTVPMGTYYISEASRRGEILSIVAYDAMTKFDKPFEPLSGTATAYEWLQMCCNACGVTLGTTESYLRTGTYTNGKLTLTLVWKKELKTYRDVLRELAEALGMVCRIGRDNKLYLTYLGGTLTETIGVDDRFSSEFADFTWKADTFGVKNIETGEVFTASNENGGVGVYFETNSFLQMDGEDRSIYGYVIRSYTPTEMLLNLATRYTDFSTVPFEAKIPLNPCFDPLDRVAFSGRASNNAGGIITEIVMNLSGATTIKCSGQDTQIGASEIPSSEPRGDEGVLNIAAYDNNNNDTTITVPNTFFSLTEVSYTPLKEFNRGVLSTTVNYVLESDDPTILEATVMWQVWNPTQDPNYPIWTLMETLPLGAHITTLTCPIQMFNVQLGQGYAFVLQTKVSISSGARIFIRKDDARSSFIGYAPSIERIYWQRGPTDSDGNPINQIKYTNLNLTGSKILGVFNDGSETEITPYVQFTPPAGTYLTEDTVTVTAAFTPHSGKVLKSDRTLPCGVPEALRIVIPESLLVQREHQTRIEDITDEGYGYYNPDLKALKYKNGNDVIKLYVEWKCDSLRWITEVPRAQLNHTRQTGIYIKNMEMTDRGASDTTDYVSLPRSFTEVTEKWWKTPYTYENKTYSHGVRIDAQWVGYGKTLTAVAYVEESPIVGFIGRTLTCSTPSSLLLNAANMYAVYYEGGEYYLEDISDAHWPLGFNVTQDNHSYTAYLANGQSKALRDGLWGFWYNGKLYDSTLYWGGSSFTDISLGYSCENGKVTWKWAGDMGEGSYTQPD